MVAMPYEIGDLADYDWQVFLTELADVEMPWTVNAGLRWLHDLAVSFSERVEDLQMEDWRHMDYDTIGEMFYGEELHPIYVDDAIQVFSDLGLYGYNFDDLGVSWSLDGSCTVADLAAMALDTVARRLFYGMIGENKTVKQWKWRALPEEARAVAAALEGLAV